MEITTASLQALNLTLSTAFQGGLGMAASQRLQISTEVPSTTGENIYPFLRDMPGMREWIGPRVIHGREASDYRVINRPFEDTFSIGRDFITDDKLSVFSTYAQGLGQAAAETPDRLTFAGLKDGWVNECWDGQPYFDTDHPIRDEDGAETTFANTDGGVGAPWFLMCTTRPLKPIIFQTRQAAQFASMTDPANPHVFMNKEFVYGADARWGVGYAHPQLCWGSKQPLDADSYEAARAAIMAMKGDFGRPLGLVPDLLVVNSANEGVARKILEAENTAAGASNTWRGTAKILLSPWLN